MKRTPGKWDWKLAVLDNGDERVIFVDEQGSEIHPTLGDVTLMAVAPEMYGLLKQVADVKQDSHTTLESINAFLERVNVEEERR